MGLGFSHTDAKALQVNFPHGPFADDAVVAVAVFLLIVGGVVFDGGAAARMTLHASGNGGGCLSGDQGILRIVLKVTAAADVPVDVQGGGQPQMDAKALHLISHDGTVGLCQRKVETLGDGGSDGDSGGVLVLYLLSLFGFSAAADQIHDKAGRGRQEGEKTLGNHAAADSVGSLLIPVKFLGKPQTCGTVGHDEDGEALFFQYARGLSRRAGHVGGGVSDDTESSGLRVEGPHIEVGQFLHGEIFDSGIDLPLLIVGYRDGFDVSRGDGDPGDIRQFFRCSSLTAGGLPVLKVRFSEAVSGLCHDRFPVQIHKGGRLCVIAAVTHANHIASRLQHVRFLLRVIGSAVPEREGDGQFLGSPRLQEIGLGKGCQILIGFIQPSRRRGHIDLHHFPSRAGAGVGDGGFDADSVSLCGRPGHSDIEGGVGETVTEGKQRFLSHRVKIPVSHVDPLFVAGVVDVAEFAFLAVILPGSPGGCQLAGGICPAQQNVCQHTARLHAELGQNQNVGDLFHGSQIYHTAHIQHQHEFLILRVQGENGFRLRVGQADVSRDRLPVIALAGDAGEHIDGGIAFPVQGQIIFRLGHDSAHALQNRHGVFLFCPLLDLFYKCLLGILFHLVEGVQPAAGGNGKSGALQALLHIDGVAGIYLPGTGAALYGVADAVAVGRDPAGSLQGKRAVLPQEQRTFRQGIPKEPDVFFLIIKQFHKTSSLTLLSQKFVCFFIEYTMSGCG